MTDKFALLNELRRPWLEQDALKAKFLSISGTEHPDRAHTERKAAEERFAQLNAAYQCLRDPKERLKHLLELERGTKPQQVQNVPGELMDCSLTVAQLCRQVDAFLAEKAATTSPLLQVPLFERGHEWREKVNGLQSWIIMRREDLLKELKELDSRWISSGKQENDNRQSIIDRLGELSGLLTYFDRWHVQLQERLVQLSF